MGIGGKLTGANPPPENASFFCGKFTQIGCDVLKSQ
jgi:hypothetical protein